MLYDRLRKYPDAYNAPGVRRSCEFIPFGQGLNIKQAGVSLRSGAIPRVRISCRCSPLGCDWQ